MAISIKFTKFDNTPWGFRLAGGSDFPQPLTVIRVAEESLAECMGLKVGDVVVRLNDQSISSLTHGQAHEALVHAGNNFVLGVQREEEARKAAEAISEENIVPYKISLADLPPVFPEEILKEETVIERYEEENTVVEPLSAEDEIRQEETKLAEEKPVDDNSEIVPNKNLTDDEIAQLILEEEELLSDKGLLGVNFKKLRPRASILKDSKVLEELQELAIAEPVRVQELKRTSTFLQKPQRPVPKLKIEPKVEEDEGETYKVVIKKQDRKTVIARLVEKGLLPSGSEATIARTPEPPEPSEVKMHETENKVEENRPLVVSNSNSSCSISLDNTDKSLSSPCPESDSNEFLISEDQLAPHETYNYKSKLLHVKPSHSRRFSAPGRCDEVGARSLFKGRYLENILRGYTRSSLRDRQVDGFYDIGFSPNETRRRSSRCERAHYAEKILLRNVNAVARHFHPKSSSSKSKTTRGCRMKGKYLETYLRRESIRLMSLITTFFQFVLQRPGVSESSNLPKIHERRLSFKGRYFEHVLQKNVAPVLECVKETCYIDDQPKMIETDASDLKISEWHEDRPACPLQKKLSFTINTSDNPDEEETAESGHQVLEWSSNPVLFEEAEPDSAEPTDMLSEDTLSKFLQSAENYVSAEVFHRGSRRLSKPRKSIDVTSEEDDKAVSKFLQSAEDYVSTEVFHRGSRRLSKPRKSIDVTPKEDDKAASKFLQSAEDYVSAEVFHRGSRRLSKPRKSIDVTSEEDDKAVSKFLQSAEDYVSTEVFHRGSRRLSKPRKSIDVTPKEDDKAASKFLQSAEDYVSAEVFHRGSRRLSKPRKSIDVTPKEDDKAVSKFLQSAEDYVSTEVFHRGSRRLSKPRKSIDVTPKEDDKAASKFLQSAEDYVSAEVFHRGSRRFSKPRKSIDVTLKEDDKAVSKFLQSAEDYVSTEVFHRGSRRLSRSHKREEQGEEDALSNALRSTGNYVSGEVFHRGSRRLSRSYRRESVSLVPPTLWGGLKSMYLNLPWFSFAEKSTERSGDCEEKINPEIEYDERRLSFVPTILYQGITNSIGVDFTKLVVYAFIPCTSIILLYMFK